MRTIAFIVWVLPPDPADPPDPAIPEGESSSLPQATRANEKAAVMPVSMIALRKERVAFAMLNSVSDRSL
jgi:hypothetical protein